MEENKIMEQRNQVLTALTEWVIKVTTKEEAAPQEIASIASVADVILRHQKGTL